MALPRGLWIVVIVVAATLVLLAAVFRQGQPGRALTSTVPGIVTGAERFPSVVRCGGHVQYAGDAGASRMNTGGRGASSQRYVLRVDALSEGGIHPSHAGVSP